MFLAVNTFAAVVLTSDRNPDRAGGADAIANAIVQAGFARADEFTVIPPIPAEEHASDPIHPHTNIITDCPLALKTKLVMCAAVLHVPANDDSPAMSMYFIDITPEPSRYTAAYMNLSKYTTVGEFKDGLLKTLTND
jgi:hypothetical protein